ncbi:MAG: hypothetical protein IJV02_04925 [Candidatus Methanomethylophilaceae archaeon]|nr:hypothetical protein [Candidatus Methanomethylophilaceae archaeon]
MAVDFLKSQKTGKVPLVMYVLDVILAIVLTRNLWSFIVSIQSVKIILYNPDQGIQYLYLLLSSIYISYSTMLTMMTLQSAKKESWRAAARRMLIIGVMGFVNEFLSIGTPVMLFRETMIVVTIAYIILFLPGVRKYYTPPLSEDKSILAWIRYILIKPKDWNYVYTFNYSKEKD